MRKVYLLFLLLLTSFCYSQVEGKQNREIFNKLVTVFKGEVKAGDAETIIFFEYCGKPLVKMYLPNGAIGMYNRISTIGSGKTEDGADFTYAIYRSDDANKIEILIQRFNKEELGCRILFEDKDMIQLYH